MNVRVSSRQSIFDLAIQTGGGIEASFSLALQNNVSLTDELQPGQELQTADMVDRDVASYYNSHSLTPATALTDSVFEAGIGYWTIEFDFAVK
jgi:hypothetical protein